MDPYSFMDTANAWKKSHFILLDKSDFHTIDIDHIEGGNTCWIWVDDSKFPAKL